MITKIVSCTLAAGGLLLFLWCLTGAFLLPARGFTLRCRACGDGEGLEQQIRGAAWLFDTGLIKGSLEIADCGLSPAGLDRARRLARSRRYIEIVPEDNCGGTKGTDPRERSGGDLSE